MFTIKDEVEKAEKRIRSYVRKTPLEKSFCLSKISKSNVYFKLENMQHTGSFKARGAFSKLLSLSGTEKNRGIITASSGNHGLGSAYALNRLDINGTIYLPENASLQKVSMLKDYNANLKFIGTDCEFTENSAKETANRNNKIYISPYNDPQIIGGQGTIAIELKEQIKKIDNIFVSVGGGGLISGISCYLKSINHKIKIIGCLPENSPAMFDAVKSKKIVSSKLLPTLSDGTAGGIEENSITLAPCISFVDDWILISEKEIKEAMKLVFVNHRLVIEGSAAVSVASLLRYKEHIKGQNSIIIICGGNIDMNVFKKIVF
ncbi:MAG TPA: threonine/serine dehydratase [Victivallales bacterium]|nr:threonine/serine dehydratase [Victivallales bacterium]